VGVFAVKDTSSRKLSKATSFINDNFRGIIKNSLKCESALVNAATDFLTGIANKETLLRELEALFKMADRYKHDLSLCFFGVDHFKLFNDAYGHPAGDAILRELAKRVSSAVRKTDIVARYGGEKFCIVFPMTDKKTAISVAEKIRAQVEHTRFTTPEGPLPVRISMGVASFPIDTIADVQTLIDKADRALLHAKKTRNKAVGYADSMTTLPKKEIKRGQGQLRRQEK
jgi:diguanylate cyclase